jgi:hypothetical protein
VTVSLKDPTKPHDIAVTVNDASGDVLFQNDYQLSDSNEADEDAPFPASSDPATVLGTVDGTQFERDWPGFEQRQLPCMDPNTSGIELWIDISPDGSPELRLEADCQRVTME